MEEVFIREVIDRLARIEENQHSGATTLVTIADRVSFNDSRLSSLERWRYTLTGAWAVLAAMIGGAWAYILKH